MYFSPYVGTTILIVLVILSDISLTEVVFERLWPGRRVADLQCIGHLYKQKCDFVFSITEHNLGLKPSFLVGNVNIVIYK